LWQARCRLAQCCRSAAKGCLGAAAAVTLQAQAEQQQQSADRQHVLNKMTPLKSLHTQKLFNWCCRSARGCLGAAAAVTLHNAKDCRRKQAHFLSVMCHQHGTNISNSTNMLAVEVHGTAAG
jgi:hypothetical protein